MAKNTVNISNSEINAKALIRTDNPNSDNTINAHKLKATLEEDAILQANFSDEKQKKSWYKSSTGMFVIYIFIPVILIIIGIIPILG